MISTHSLLTALKQGVRLRLIEGSPHAVRLLHKYFHFISIFCSAELGIFHLLLTNICDFLQRLCKTGKLHLSDKEH